MGESKNSAPDNRGEPAKPMIPDRKPQLSKMPLWRKALVALSIVAMVGGGAVTAMNRSKAKSASDAGANTNALNNGNTGTGTGGSNLTPNGLAPKSLTGEDIGNILKRIPGLPGSDKTDGASKDGSGTGTAGGVVIDQDGVRKDQPTTDWSPLAFKLGFGFFVGFCIGVALRGFFKISLAALGVLFLVLFGMQYAGYEVVNWAEFERIYHQGLDWLKTQTQSFQGFVTGQLPSAGTAILGLFVGFKKF